MVTAGPAAPPGPAKAARRPEQQDRGRAEPGSHGEPPFAEEREQFQGMGDDLDRAAGPELFRGAGTPRPPRRGSCPHGGRWSCPPTNRRRRRSPGRNAQPCRRMEGPGRVGLAGDALAVAEDRAERPPRQVFVHALAGEGVGLVRQHGHAQCRGRPGRRAVRGSRHRAGSRRSSPGRTSRGNPPRNGRPGRRRAATPAGKARWNRFPTPSPMNRR